MFNPTLIILDLKSRDLASYYVLCMQIYNMLRKKHKQANEVLIQAVVNNNNLLMLNLPIYIEKCPSSFRFEFVIGINYNTWWVKKKIP